MELEGAAIDAGEEIAAEPGNQDCQGTETGGKEGEQKRAPVMEAELEPAAIASAKFLEAFLKALLGAYERIAAGGIAGLMFLSPQQVFRHGWDDGPGKKI